METIAYILLGSDLGDRVTQLQQAIDMIGLRGLGQILKASNIYETEAWGFKSESKFLNQVIQLQTKLTARELLNEVLKIENDLGRYRAEGEMLSRSIDIDILLFGNKIIDEPGLSIPHPRMNLRRFTLVPLVEIAAQDVHPVTGETFEVILSKCNDTLAVLPLQIQAI